MAQSHATPTVTVGGVHELTRVWEADNPKADLVLVHGISEHSGRYEHVGVAMARAGIQVEGFDLIGHGASGGARVDVDDWSVFLDQVQGHLEPLIDAGRPTVLLGHSMGGLVASEYLVSGRPLPNLAVLSAPALAGGAKWQRVLSARLAGLVGRLPIPSDIKGEQLSRDPDVGLAYFSDPLVFTKPTVRFGNELFEAMDRTNLAIASLSVPTLVIHGTSDTVVPFGASEPFSGIESAERRPYPDLRHELFNEPEGGQIVREVIEWIEAHL